MVADHRRGDTLAEIARQILAAAPGRFRLAGLSMGGYIALEIMRQAPGRVTKLALLDTSARPETPEQTERRNKLIALAEQGRMREIMDVLWLLMVDPQTATEGQRRSYASVNAHEMAHHWTGDLVTMPWWDDIWLNEAFASWMDSKIIRQWKPEWNTALDEQNTRLGAMGGGKTKHREPWNYQFHSGTSMSRYSPATRRGNTGTTWVSTSTMSRGNSI